MSRAERFALAGAVALLLMQVLVAAFDAAGPALEYQRATLASAPWRVLTAHWVHINTLHVLINAAAWFVVARLFAHELEPVRQAVVIGVSSAAIALALAWRWPEIAWYRGFSGVLHALYFSGAATWLLQAIRTRMQSRPAALWLPAALFVGGWVKVIFEQPADGGAPFAAWLGAATVPQAHLVGALCGTVLGAVFALASTARSNLPAHAREKAE